MESKPQDKEQKPPAPPKLPEAIGDGDLQRHLRAADRVESANSEITLLEALLVRAKSESKRAQLDAMTHGQALNTKYSIGPQDTFNTLTGAIARNAGPRKLEAVP